MKYKITKHKDEIITGIIKNLIWFPIAAIIPLLWKLLCILYDNFTQNSEYITFQNILSLICLILSIISIILWIVYFIKRKNKTLSENNNSISSDLRFSTIEAELIFDDNRQNIISAIDYKMTVLSESVSELKREIIWSGNKYNGTRLVSMNGDYQLIDTNRESSPYPYTINFNSEKKRGDFIEFKTETSVTDENYTMLPRYSFMVKYQIDKLILRVVAPRNMIKNVKKAIYADRAKEICVEKPKNITREKIRELERYTFEIENPSLLYNFFIEWEFTK